MASFKWRSNVCVICVLRIQGECSTPSSHPAGPEEQLGAPSRAQRSDLPCTGRASGRTARSSFSTWPDLILLRDFTYINNTWFAVAGPSYMPLHQYSGHLHSNTSCIEQNGLSHPIPHQFCQYGQEVITTPPGGPLFLDSKVRRAEKKESNKSIGKTKHFLEEFTKKIKLKKPTVTETQTLVHYRPAHAQKEWKIKEWNIQELETGWRARIM